MLRVLFVLVLCLPLFLPRSAPAEEKERKNVLYLNSYQNGYPWSDEILKGIRLAMDESAYHVVLQIEYMDSKRYTDFNLRTMLHEFYKHKFRSTAFDAVIVSDNYAFEFVREFRDELFPDVPVVFCGVNDLTPEEAASLTGFTGVVENPDFAGNIALAARLHPERTKVLVIGDRSITGVAIQNQVRAVAPLFAGRLSFEYADNLSLQEILSVVRSIPDDTMIFLIPFYKDSAQQIHSVSDVLSAVYANTTAPILSAWEFMLGSGIIGGKLHSGVAEGRVAGKMIDEILAGKSPSSIPVVFETEDEYVFDYNVISRQKIDADKLPPGSRLINEPYRFYQVNITVFWIIIISLIILSYVLVLLVTNILMRRKVEEEIKNQLSFLETLLGTIPIPLYFKDASGAVTGCNPAFRAFLGLPPEPAARDDKGVIASRPAAGLMRDHDASLLAAPGVGVEETTLPGPGGEDRVVILHRATYAKARGQTAGLVGVIYDITERTRAAKEKYDLERQLLQSQKMEALGTLAGGIAHDFNNILTSIINSAELALLDLPEEAPETEDLRRVLAAGQRGGRLVKRILSFTRPSQAGFVETDAREAVREAVSFIKASVPRTIRVVERLPEEPLVCLADPTQLNQIVMNLLTNAFQSLRETGGHLDIELARDVLCAEDAARLSLPPGAYARLGVADDGPGIPPEIMDRIFDPFFTTKGKGEGTGLGLSVVGGLVKAHGGAIAVSSQPGRRTAFDIWLPLLGREVGHGECVEPAPGRGREHILFVEDDEDQLATIPRVLAGLGHRVSALSAADAALALVMAPGADIELVITDYDMPEANGLDLARRLAEAAPDIPVILVSGRLGDLEGLPRPRNVKKIVPKPYDRHVLARAIRRVLDGRDG